MSKDVLSDRERKDETSPDYIQDTDTVCRPVSVLKSSRAPRLFHLRLRCILNERGIFIVDAMVLWIGLFC